MPLPGVTGAFGEVCADERNPEGYSRSLRSSPGLSTKVMNERLRKMTRFGIVQRSVFGEKPPLQVEYVLTDFGSRFMGILNEVHRLQEAVDKGTIF